MRSDMRSHSNRPPARSAPPARRQEPLADQRYQDLIHRASAFFAAAERDVEAEKSAAIVEIKDLMLRYGLTLEDVLAQG